MAIFLDAKASDFEARVRRAHRRQARDGGGRRRRGGRNHRRSARPRRCGARRILSAFRSRRCFAPRSKITPEEVEAALSACDPKAIEALKFAYERVLDLSPAPDPGGRFLHRCARRKTRLALAADRIGRALRARRKSKLSLVGADERGAGDRRRLQAHRDGRADPRRKAQSAGARRGAHRRRRRNLSRWRRAGGGGACLRHSRRSGRWRRSSGPATPMSRRRSGGCSASSAST